MEISSAPLLDTVSSDLYYLFDLVGLGHLDRHDTEEQNTLLNKVTSYIHLTYTSCNNMTKKQSNER